MNKQEIIDKIALKTGLTKKDAAAALDAIFDTKTGIIVETLKKNEKFAIIGFGSFEARLTKARTGRNPSTGKEIQIPEGKKPAFSAGKSLKDNII